MANVFPLDLRGNYRKPAPASPSLGDGSDVVVSLGGDDDNNFDADTGTTQIPLADGSIEISIGEPPLKKPKTDSDKFNANLAEHLSDGTLSQIAEKLLLGIEQDDQSRSKWLENLSAGISLLGLEVKQPRGAAASGGNPQEGTSTVDHPLLLEAVLRFQANARGELLPSDGPVKVRNDGEGNSLAAQLATALEKDLNHYLTKTAKEYVPDTDRMLLMLGFCGISFKKGYHDPVKRRPVIASIDAKDLIVSNAATDVDGCGRVTHRIMMRPSLIKRMQLVGAYRDIYLSPLTSVPVMANAVDNKINQVQGIAPANYIEPDDQEREFYECYCEIELPGFEHELDGEETGLPLPYKVVIDKESRQILEIRRNWDEDDEFCMPLNRIVAYIFIPGFGFYGIGLLNILGNATKAVTASWRLMIDAGMFANFPGFLYLKAFAKQLTNQFRVAPGSGLAVDTTGNDIRTAVMPLPYKDPSAVFIQLIENIATTAQRVGGTAELQVGEGKQDAPVGTTLAMIEQATKLMSAVHKRLHHSQGVEFGMLKELLMEDPAALWRHNKKSKVLKLLMAQTGQQQVAEQQQQAEERHKALFIAALNDCELTPRADPNTSSQTERYLKVVAMRQMAMTNPQLDINQVDQFAFQVMGVDDAQRFFKPPPDPSQAQPSPEELTAQATMMAAQARIQEAQTKASDAQAKAQASQQELASKEKIAQLGVSKELVIHQSDQQRASRDLAFENQQRSVDRLHQLAIASQKNRATIAEGVASRHFQLVNEGLARQHEAVQSGLDRKHEFVLQHHDRQHGVAGDHMQRQHDAVQADANRRHEANEAESQRRHDAAIAELQRKAQAAKLKPKASAK